MLRRSFLRLAGAAALGVMAAKVPVFAEELPVVGDFKACVKPIVTTMWVYPAHYALPIEVPEQFYKYTMLHLKRFNELTSTITVESVPSNIDSTWRLTDVRS